MAEGVKKKVLRVSASPSRLREKPVFTLRFLAEARRTRKDAEERP